MDEYEDHIQEVVLSFKNNIVKINKSKAILRVMGKEGVIFSF